MLDGYLSTLLCWIYFRNKFGRFKFYANLTMYTLYLILLTIYYMSVPFISTNILDNVRSCPVLLTDAEKQNQTIVQAKIDVSFYVRSDVILMSY